MTTSSSASPPRGVARGALKEWAVLCRALATGQQSLLLRKGGLHDPRPRGARAREYLILRSGEPARADPPGGTFALRFRRFLLVPTDFHARAPERAAQELRAPVHAGLAPASSRPLEERPLEAFAELRATWWIEQLDPLRQLSDAGALLYSRAGVERRFAPNPRARRRELQRPGAWLLLVRVFRLPPRSAPITLATHSPRGAARGCTSWIELERPVPIADARPALPDAIHEQRARGLYSLLGASAF